MPKKIDEAKIQQYMKTFDLDEADAIQMIEDDLTIDAGGKCDWEKELTPEQKRAVRQARTVDRTVKTETGAYPPQTWSESLNSTTTGEWSESR